jgi:hypothetical protein
MKRFRKNHPRLIVLVLMGACVAARPATSQDHQATQFINADSSGQRNLTNPMPPQVSAVADYTAQILVQAHCSRLLVTHANVTRTFVADPRIAEVVQFRPGELALIGLEPGYTTVTMWFENTAEPLNYLVATVPPPVEIKPSGGRQSSRVEETAGAFVDGPRAGPEPGYLPIRRPQIVENPGAAQFGVRPAKAVAGARSAASGLPRPRYDGHTPWLEADRTAPRGNSRTGSAGNRQAAADRSDRGARIE